MIDEMNRELAEARAVRAWYLHSLGRHAAGLAERRASLVDSSP